MTQVTVVMSVHNGAPQLVATMDSLLTQDGVDFEIIVVDDGSTDATPIILECYAARDHRVRVIHLAKVGLTRGLIAGCDAARGEFIARQDCGDRSLPGRLALQAQMLSTQAEVALVAVGARFFGPRGEPLYEIAQTSDDLRRGLSHVAATSLRGPSHHGATMFRKNAYQAARGYRATFEVAQDLDLWTRLVERGACAATPEIFYEATLSMGAVSDLRRAEQIRASGVIADCIARRRRGESEAATLANWRSEQLRFQTRRRPAEAAAAFCYFIGGALRTHDRDAAEAYYREALRHAPYAAKIRLRLAQLRAARAFADMRQDRRAWTSL